jgi:uncharacterized protein
MIELEFAPELRFFLPIRFRSGLAIVPSDGMSSLGHVVESLGVPLTEVGGLSIAGRPAAPATRPAPGDRVGVRPVRRPQPLQAPRFVLDVHLGALARRMRLVGLDTAYRNDASDTELVDQANAEHRVALTKDRGLLRRRKLWSGAFVRYERPDDQLADVLDRFGPPLRPWTRCPACNGLLAPVAKHQVEDLLLAGTRRTYQEFSRCAGCGRIYWRGAHARRLEDIVARSAGLAKPTEPTPSSDRKDQV